MLFSFVKQLKKSPEQLGQELGTDLVQKNPGLFTAFNVIKGFLNLSVADAYWNRFLNDHYLQTGFGSRPLIGKKVMVEYASPNTNKPLHLGHLRNIFLGWSTAAILNRSRSFRAANEAVMHAGQYDFEPFSFGALSARMDMTYKDEVVFHPFNNQYDAADDHTLINGRISLNDIKLGCCEDGSLRVSLWGKNLTDEEYRQWGIDFGSLGWAGDTFGEPRTRRCRPM